jgi:Flp pilus assembly protein TadB
MINDPKLDTEDHPSYAPEVKSLEKPSFLATRDGSKKQHRLGNSLALLFALMGLGLVAVLIVGCSGGNPVVLLLILAMGGFLFLHYIVWGRLLSRTGKRDNDYSDSKE